MKKLAVLLLFSTISLSLISCAPEDTSDTMSTEDIVQQFMTPSDYGFTEVVDVMFEGDGITLINGYVGTDKQSCAFDNTTNELILEFNPDTSVITECDMSIYALNLIAKYTKLNPTIFASNIEILASNDFDRDYVLASNIGNNKIVSATDDTIVADGHTYTILENGALRDDENSIDIDSYEPMLRQSFFRKVNTKAFEETTGITVPITVTELESNLRSISKHKTLADCYSDGAIVPVELNVEGITVTLNWPLELIEPTKDNLVSDNSLLRIQWKAPDEYTSADAVLLSNNLGSPNVVYMKRDGNSIHYTAIYRLLDDIAEDAIVFEFDEELWNTEHVISGVTLSYCNDAYMNETSFGSKPMYSSEELMEEIKHYAG